MPPAVRRIVERLSAKCGISPHATFDTMLAVFSKTLPDNLCAGCGEMMRHAPAGFYVISETTGAAVGSVCDTCVERYRTDYKFAARIDSEGYRAAHGAGPDDVAGTA